MRIVKLETTRQTSREKGIPLSETFVVRVKQYKKAGRIIYGKYLTSERRTKDKHLE